MTACARTYALAAVIVGLLGSSTVAQEPSPLRPPKLGVPYGNNKKAGAFEELNGIKLYVETYGAGQPMLQIHGNGESIASMGYQIKFFADRYRVIVADSRGHGKSDLGSGRLTYEQMAEDMNALLEKRGVKSVYVLGWSDGGIIGLLLAIHHPDKVGRLAIMGANLNPAGAYDWALDLVAAKNKQIDEAIAKGDTSQPWALLKQYFDLLGKQPNIPVDELKAVTMPTLVMAGDRDVIRDQHTLEIFHGLPNANLAIFPGATHMIPWQNPDLFNRTVETFFAKPFARPDTKDILSPMLAANP
jgi:pimeloyl-ACP methyl ester carboxylesterase